MKTVCSKQFTRGWCFLVFVSGILVASVYVLNFKFRIRLSPMNELSIPSHNFVTNPLNVTTQQPFNTTMQTLSAKLLKTTSQPPFSIPSKDRVPILTSITTQVPFSMTNQSLDSLLLNATAHASLDRRHYICYVPQGRLGNHLFQYASIYGIATLNNLSIMTPESCEICNYFRVQNVTVSSDKNACSKFQLLSETMPRVFTPKLLTLPKNTDFYVRGYFESWKYFQNVTDSLLKQLSFKEPIETMARREMDNLKSKYMSNNGSNLTVIGIHVRMGDLFGDPQFHERGLDPAPPGYINKTIRYYMTKYDKILFIVCSDTIQQAKATIESFNISVNISYMEGKRKPIDDLAILAKCHHVIQTVGTFGWWAAYLSGGTSIYYKFPARLGSSAEKQFNSYDFFYPEWIGLEED